MKLVHLVGFINLLKPNDIYIYISYRSTNLQTLHFIYLFNVKFHERKICYDARSHELKKKHGKTSKTLCFSEE